MTVKTATAEEVFKNWSAMYDDFCEAEESLQYPTMCTHCGIDDTIGRFGSDYLCEGCLTLVGDVLAKIKNGLETDTDGSIAIAP